MKTFIKNIAGLALLLFIITIFTYNKNKSNSTATSKALLSGFSNKRWRLDKIIYDGMEQCISDCYRNNNRLTFFTNGNYIQASYKCDDNLCGNFSSQNEKNGQWKLEQEDVLRIGTYNYNLLSINANELVLEIKQTKYYYINISTELTTPEQLLTGNGSKRWKYSKCIVDGIEQELSPAQKSVRFINEANGTLIANHTNSSVGSNFSGTWMISQDGNTYTSICPAYANFPPLKQTYTIVELTDKTFIITYNNLEGQLIELHEVAC